MKPDRKTYATNRVVIRKIRNFMLSKQSREFLIFLFFVLLSALFWLLQVLNNDYETDLQIPLRLKNVPEHVEITDPLPESLTLHVKDRGTVLFNYVWGKTFLPVGVDYRAVTKVGGRASIATETLKQRVAGQLNQTTRLLSLKPDTVGFGYSAVLTKKVQAVRPEEVTDAEMTVEVPVKGVNFPADKVLRTFPAKVGVTVRVAMDDIRKVTADDFFVGVTYEDLLKTGSQQKCSVVLKAMPDFVNHARLNPSEVDYLIEQHNEP